MPVKRKPYFRWCLSTSGDQRRSALVARLLANQVAAVMTLYLNVIAGGILIGVVYALIALGLTIIFGVMRIVNFAHGEMVVIGMYVGYGIWSVIQSPALDDRTGGRVWRCLL